MPSEPENPAKDGVEIGPGLWVHESVLRFSFASSSGPGGQNVNKKATKAILRVWPRELPLTHGAHARLLDLARSWLTEEGEIVIAADEHRTQSRNQEACLDRLRAVVVKALVPPKPRRKTRVPKGVIRARLDSKRRRADAKKSRRRPGGSADERG